MLIREEQNKKVGHVEFMSYTGKYPSLSKPVYGNPHIED